MKNLRSLLVSSLLLWGSVLSESRAADTEARQECRARQQAIEKVYLDGLVAITDKASASKLYELAQMTADMGLQIDPADASLGKKARIIKEQLALPLVIKKTKSPDRVSATDVIKVLKSLTAERTSLQEDTAVRLVKLADWCRQQDLLVAAVDILKRAESIDDRNVDIKKALGKKYIMPYGWLDQEAQKRIKLGNIPIDGAWKSKEELLKEEAQPLTWRRAHEFRSANFLIRADLPFKKILAIADVLETHHQRFYASVGGPIALPRLRDMAICCFAKKADYVAHAKRCSRMKNGDKRIAYSSPACKSVPFKHYAVSEKKIRTIHMIYSAKNELLNQRVLQHESTHGFLRSVGRAALRTDSFDHTYISAFAIEGMATYFEPGSGGYLRSCKAQVKAKSFVPLRKFVLMTNPSFNRAALYAQANGLTHFFMIAHKKKYRRAFLELVYHVHARVSTPQSFEDIFGRPPAALEDEWIAYMNALEIK